MAAPSLIRQSMSSFPDTVLAEPVLCGHALVQCKVPLWSLVAGDLPVKLLILAQDTFLCSQVVYILDSGLIRQVSLQLQLKDRLAASAADQVV